MNDIPATPAAGEAVPAVRFQYPGQVRDSIDDLDDMLGVLDLAINGTEFMSPPDSEALRMLVRSCREDLREINQDVAALISQGKRS